MCGDVKYAPRVCRENAPRVAGENKRHRARPPGRPRKEKKAQVRPASTNVTLTKYPKVLLYDVAREFEINSSDFSCILPVKPERKRERTRSKCFMKGFGSLARNGDVENCAKWIVGKSLGMCIPTNRSASLSSGDQASGESDASVNQDGLDPEANNVTRKLDRETFRLASGVEHSRSTAASGDLSSGRYDRSIISRHVSDRHGVRPERKHQNNPAVKRTDSTHGPEDAGASESSDEEAETGSPSCQRTREYKACSYSSCARTSWTWPFPRHGSPEEVTSSIGSDTRWVTSDELGDHVQTPDQGTSKMPTSNAQKKNARTTLSGGNTIFWTLTLGVTKDAVRTMKTRLMNGPERTAGDIILASRLNPNNHRDCAQNHQTIVTAAKGNGECVKQGSEVRKNISNVQSGYVRLSGNVLRSFYEELSLTSAGQQANKNQFTTCEQIPDPFSCRRTTAFDRSTITSCARTDRSWPFRPSSSVCGGAHCVERSVTGGKNTTEDQVLESSGESSIVGKRSSLPEPWKEKYLQESGNAFIRSVGPESSTDVTTVVLRDAGRALGYNRTSNCTINGFHRLNERRTADQNEATRTNSSDCRVSQEKKTSNTENDLQDLKSCNQTIMAQDRETRRSSSKPSEASEGSTELQSASESVRVFHESSEDPFRMCSEDARGIKVDARAPVKEPRDLPAHPDDGCCERETSDDRLNMISSVGRSEEAPSLADGLCPSVQMTPNGQKHSRSDSGQQNQLLSGAELMIPGLVSVPLSDRKSVHLRTFSANRRLSTQSRKHAGDTENKPGALTGRIKTQTQTTTVSSAVPALSDSPDPDRSRTGISDVELPVRSSAERKWKHDSSSSTSSDEDIGGPSSSEQSDEDETAEVADDDTDSAPNGLKFKDCDLDLVRAYEEDAIVLDVIQDDPQLFGRIHVETEATDPKNGTGAVPVASEIPARSRKIVWDLDSQRCGLAETFHMCLTQL